MNKLENITKLIERNTSLNSGCAENLAKSIFDELEIVQPERLNEENVDIKSNCTKCNKPITHLGICLECYQHMR